MKIQPSLKLILILAFSIVVVGIGSYFLLSPKSNNSNLAQALPDKLFGWKYPVTKFPLTGSNPNQVAYSSIRDPGGIAQGLPVRLLIPSIGVDSAVEDALITPDGRMDVPLGSRNVAWFSLGPHPGQEGSAVIGGHFGISNGMPFVFYNLDKLKVGDKAYVKDDKDETLVFVVRSVSSFDRNADATTVFTSHDGLAHLNIITCEGIWNQINDTYPQRLVVFTDAIPVERAAEPTFVFPRTLNMGSQGPDVSALQTVLEQKGFFTMPSGLNKGFFGLLTRAGVVKYQTSAGLQPVGVFGPLTRAKLIAELTSKTALPNTGITTVVYPGIVTSPSSLQVLNQIVENVLYSNLIDGLITSLLLISILFVALKILWR